jgi:hypothetical protein
MGTVIDNLNGYIFKSRKEFKKSVLTLFNDKSLLTRMKKQARNSAEVHSSKYFAEHILDVYKIAIKNKNKQKKSIGEKIIEIIGGRK